MAERPTLPLMRCLPVLGSWQSSRCRKYADHLPLHRQVRIFRRQGFQAGQLDDE